MENDIIYFSDFPNLQETGTRKDNGKFDLTLLPTQELKEEFRGYIMYRCKNGTFRALIQDRTAYNHIAKFLNSRINRRIKSLGDRNPEKWISLLKGWMLEQGITIVKESGSTTYGYRLLPRYGTASLTTDTYTLDGGGSYPGLSLDNGLNICLDIMWSAGCGTNDLNCVEQTATQ